MTEPENATPESLRELQEVLDLLVRRMTHRAFATPRQMQMDVGTAMTMVTRMGYFPRRALVAKALPDLLRELGKRRPDLHRYVLLLEETVTEIHTLLGTARPG